MRRSRLGAHASHAVGVVVAVAVGAALFISGTLALFTYPELRGYGHGLRNPTSLPHDYAANLGLVVAAVVLGTAVTALVRGLLSASRR